MARIPLGRLASPLVIVTGERKRTGKSLGGESPLGPLMTGNPSGTATAAAVRRGGKEAVCKAPAGRRETAYEASKRSA